jgi:hypothetical protein
MARECRRGVRSFVVVACVLTGCATNGEGDDEGGGAATQSSDKCASGTLWVGGNAESSLMHPGRDCIGCHGSGEGPQFTIAGTVHATLTEPDDCFGVPGVTVTVHDANGQSIQMVTNEAGNFFSRAAVAMPITATLELAGHTNAMTFMPGTAACATCHSTTGANGAPGRIVAP